MHLTNHLSGAPRCAAMALLALTAWAAATPALAFPDKPMTLIVPYPPGGATDVVGRILAKALGSRLGQTMVVENKAGAGTAIGATALAQAAPDGHTLFFSSNTTYTMNPAIKSSLPYDPQKFDAIGVVGVVPLALLANPSLPASNARDVVALAKRAPGKLSYGSFGTGTSSHFGGEIFKYETGVDILHVPYKGSAPAMQDVIAGQIQLTVDTVLAAKPQADAGKVKVLAVMASRRVPMLPDVPTMIEAGYPGVVVEPWGAVVAPGGLKPDVKKQLAKALAEVLADPDVKAQIERTGFNVAHEPPASYDTRLAKELPALRALVHKAGITAQ